MKVFISWSGEKSQKVAEILKQWIPCIIQSIEPYLSSDDIDKGTRWSNDISKELQNTSYGILCVTKENLSSSWLNFEAGALSKSMEQSRVCPFLIDLKPSDIKNSPILQFQMTSNNKADIKKLFSSLNENLGDSKLDNTILTTTFDAFWSKIHESLSAVNNDSNKIKEEESAHDPLEEILELLRYQHKLLRNPSELIPLEYLAESFKQVDRLFSNEYLDEIRYRCHKAFLITRKIIEKSNDQTDGNIIDREELMMLQDNLRRIESLVGHYRNRLF